MKTQISKFPKKYRTQQQRFLYVVFSKWASISQLAEELCVSRQFVSQMLERSQIPLEYVSYLADVTNLHGALFDYTSWVLLRGADSIYYSAFLGYNEKYFTDEEYDYILAGKAPLIPTEILDITWKKALKPSKQGRKK